MPSRREVTSEREAWTAVQRQAAHLTHKFVTPQRAQEVGITVQGIADTMLEQLGQGLHANPKKKANPTLTYARALGGRIREELAGTAHAVLAERVTHDVMIGRADRVSRADAQKLYDALHKARHTHTAGQWATLWEGIHGSAR